MCVCVYIYIYIYTHMYVYSQSQQGGDPVTDMRKNHMSNIHVDKLKYI